MKWIALWWAAGLAVWVLGICGLSARRRDYRLADES